MLTGLLDGELRTHSTAQSPQHNTTGHRDPYTHPETPPCYADTYMLTSKEMVGVFIPLDILGTGIDLPCPLYYCMHTPYVLYYYGEVNGRPLG